MKSIKVGIIGVSGRYGLWLKRFFNEIGCEVFGSDIGTIMTNQAVVEKADVVVFSVPISKTVQVIGEVIPFSKPEQLWLDITSLKKDSVEKMLESRAEVVGLHPMCAPTVRNWRGQIVVVCLGRCVKWLGWVMEVLKESQAIIKMSSPDKHDFLMAFIQGLPYVCNLVMASVLRKMGVDMGESFEYITPFFRFNRCLMGRVLSQSAELYADIQMHNPHILPMLEVAKRELNEFCEIVVNGKKEGFVKEFNANKNYFGKNFVDTSSELFNNFICLMADLSEENTITLQVAESKPGILQKIIEFFTDAGVNITFFHSFKHGNEYRFLIGIDQKLSSFDLNGVIRKIQDEMKIMVKVIP